MPHTLIRKGIDEIFFQLHDATFWTAFNYDYDGNVVVGNEGTQSFISVKKLSKFSNRTAYILNSLCL